MRNVRFICMALACVLMLALAAPALAAEVDCDVCYCFGAGDFAEGEEPVSGSCIGWCWQITSGNSCDVAVDRSNYSYYVYSALR